MAIIKPKSVEEQKRTGWLIIAAGIAIAIATAAGVDVVGIFWYR